MENAPNDLKHMREHKDIFMCPVCTGNLRIIDGGIECPQCLNNYQVKNNIPLLYSPNEKNSSKENVTQVVKSFYEKTPFPNYEDFENVAGLVQKAEKSVFARLLNEQIPFNARVLEVGCGTGQLSNFLASAHRFVFGTDICFNSLKLAENFRNTNEMERVGFYQMNLFRPIFREESFSLVICSGVLHHTPDPLGGFQSIAKLVKKGGYIIVGLYHKYSRIATDLRRLIFKTCGNRFMFLDPRLRGKDIGEIKKHTWFLDQYKNPQESKHTQAEVMKWFSLSGYEFVNSIPKSKAFKTFSEKEELFSKNPKGNWLDHFLVSSYLLLRGDKEGGFFLMIGRRRF